MAIKDLYANTNGPDKTINFFMTVGKKPKTALLAAPFFTKTTPDPICELTSKGCNVRLIVRFSPITTPQAVRSAFYNTNVRIRYFTGKEFHAKLYIVDDVALIGSANLTEGGLLKNRELSVLLKKDRDDSFGKLHGIFEDLWNEASDLNEEIIEIYANAFEKWKKQEEKETQNEDRFEDFIHRFVNPVFPKGIVGSEAKSEERDRLKDLRQKYDEVLMPAFNEVLEVANKFGFGRREFLEQEPRIEIERFLCWLPVTQDGNTTLLPDMNSRAKRIFHYMQIWQSADEVDDNSNLYRTDKVIENVKNIRKYLCNPDELRDLSFNKLFDYLRGCSAFADQDRWAEEIIGENFDSLDRWRIIFQRKNSCEDVKRTVSYLLSGDGDPIERAYNCIYNKNYKIYGFGEVGVMELLGWGDTSRIPISNRTIRGIRILGFDVNHL